MEPIRTASWLTPPPLEYDDGDTVHQLRVQVRQLTLEQRAAFQDQFQQFMTPPSRALVARQSEQSDEMATDEAGAFVLSDVEVVQRRVAEMSAEDREAYQATQAQESRDRSLGISNAIRHYVVLDPSYPGQVIHTNDAGEDIVVQTGDQIVQAFVQHEAMLITLWTLIYRENFVDPLRKKVSVSPSASGRSSDAPSPAPPGATPGPTAVHVSSEVSAGNGAATEAMVAASSGALGNL